MEPTSPGLQACRGIEMPLAEALQHVPLELTHDAGKAQAALDAGLADGSERHTEL